MQRFLLISLGAVLGANLRYWIGGWAAARWGAGLPYGTLLVNVAGSLVLGLLVTVLTERYLVDSRWLTLLGIGLLGSYTTFSTYAYESVTLILAGQWLTGAANLFGSAVLGAGAALVGIYAGRWL